MTENQIVSKVAENEPIELNPRLDFFDPRRIRFQRILKLVRKIVKTGQYIVPTNQWVFIKIKIIQYLVLDKKKWLVRPLNTHFAWNFASLNCYEFRFAR